MSYFALGQNVVLEAKAPSNVMVGQHFKIEYSVNVQGASLSQPDFQGLSYSHGGTSQSVNIINGNMSVKITYYYVVSAPNAGTYTIPPISAEHNGKTYQSKELVIVAEDNPQGNPNSNSQQNNNQNFYQGQNQNNNQQVNAPTDKSNLFIDVVLNKKEVYVGEQIFLTAAFYSRYDISDLTDSKVPTFSGFWVKDISSPQRIIPEKKLINNKMYLYGFLHKKVLIPQRAGDLQIEPYSFTFITQEGSFPFYDNYERIAKSTAKTIKVKPLPQGKPSSFGGAVGKFDISISSDKKEVKLDEPITLKLTISGTGNIQLCDAPKFDLPSSFEVFPPKSSDNTKITDNGMTGSRTFSYVAIARQPGEVVIPSIEYSYFDPNSKSYKTVSTNELTINITGDRDSSAVAYSNIIKSDVENIGNDIRFIKQNSFSLSKGNGMFFNSFEFWLIFALLPIAFLLIILFRLQQIKNNANIAAVKNRKAGKTSRKRLKKAAEFMKQNKKDEFYVEILNALWGYLSDKLEISGSELTRDNVSEKLAEKNVDENSKNKYIETLDKCEFERYAPSSMACSLQDIYSLAADAIEIMDSSIKV